MIHSARNDLDYDVILFSADAEYILLSGRTCRHAVWSGNEVELCTTFGREDVFENLGKWEIGHQWPLARSTAAMAAVTAAEQLVSGECLYEPPIPPGVTSLYGVIVEIRVVVSYNLLQSDAGCAVQLRPLYMKTRIFSFASS